MTAKEAISILEFHNPFLGTDKKLTEAFDMAIKALTAQQWIPCKTRLPEEYGEYRITWITSAAPGKRFVGDAEFEVTSVWDNEHNGFEGEWLLDDYIENYPDVEVLAWKPIEEPWKGEQQ